MFCLFLFKTPSINGDEVLDTFTTPTVPDTNAKQLDKEWLSQRSHLSDANCLVSSSDIVISSLDFDVPGAHCVLNEKKCREDEPYFY